MSRSRSRDECMSSSWKKRVPNSAEKSRMVNYLAKHNRVIDHKATLDLNCLPKALAKLMDNGPGWTSIKRLARRHKPSDNTEDWSDHSTEYLEDIDFIQALMKSLADEGEPRTVQPFIVISTASFCGRLFLYVIRGGKVKLTARHFFPLKDELKAEYRVIVYNGKDHFEPAVPVPVRKVTLLLMCVTTVPLI